MNSSSDTQIVPVEKPAHLPELSRVHKSDALGKPDPYRMAHRALRGRYVTAVVLALIGATAGSLIGWRAVQPTYRSEGLLHITPWLPPVKSPSDLTGTIPDFEAYLRAQQLVLGSYRTVQGALKTPQWQATGLGSSPAVEAGFAKSLTVEHPVGSENLRVAFVDTDPVKAAAAVNAVIAAYTDIYKSHNTRSDQQRLEALTQRRDELLATQKQDQQQLEAAVKEYGTTDLSNQYDTLAKQADELTRKLGDVRLALAIRRSETKPGAAAKQEDAERATTPEEIAVVGSRLSGYLTERQRLVDSLDQLRRLNYGERHPAVMNLKASLQVIQEHINQAAEQFRRLEGGRLPLLSGGGDSALIAAQPIEALQTQEKELDSLLTKTRADMIALGVRRRQLDAVKSRSDAVRAELAEYNKRIEQIRLESTLGSRLSVVSNGEVPIQPLRDLRPIAAAAGGGLGALVPLALVLLRGLFYRRYRYSDETDSSKLPLLGIVPSLPERLTDAEQVTEAAQCVHQVRIMLQSQRPRASSSVYMLTSSSAGAGKTSLVMALGLSYSGSGSRTLVIDCDLVGQRLTRGLEGSELTGLQEALKAGTITGHAREALPNLWYLTVGRAKAISAWAVSATAMRQLLANARQQFDVVLIDTGPVLSSVEASVVAPEVDGVVVAVARGEQRPAVERALDLLRSIGARVAGVVFNRAAARDFYQTAYGQSRRPTSSRYEGMSIRIPDTDDGSTFGPLVRSVALSMPSTNGSH